MKDETQKTREILEKKILEKKQNNNELILENLRETIERALEAMNLTELHRILRENSKFTGSKVFLADWLDTQGIRKKRPVAADVTAARVEGRKAAKAARAAAKAEQKETPKPAPAAEQQQEKTGVEQPEQVEKQSKPATTFHLETVAEWTKETPKPAPEQQEKPLSGAPASVWGDDDGVIRCPECSRQNMTQKQNDRGKTWWVCGHCRKLFADNNGKIGKELPKKENGNYYLP